MQRWHEQYLGLKQFPASLSSMEIEHSFTLSESELTYVSNRRRPLNPLGVGLQIGFLWMTGQTLNSFQMVPPAVLKHLGDQLHILPPQLASIRALYRRRRTMFDHQRVAERRLSDQKVDISNRSNERHFMAGLGPSRSALGSSFYDGRDRRVSTDIVEKVRALGDEL